MTMPVKSQYECWRGHSYQNSNILQSSGPRTCHQTARPVPRAEPTHLMFNSEHPFNSSHWLCSSQPALSLTATRSFLPRNEPWTWISSISFQLSWLLRVPDVQEVVLIRRIKSPLSPRDRIPKSKNPMSPPFFTMCLQRSMHTWVLGIAKCPQNQPGPQFFLPSEGISEDQESSHCDHGPTSDVRSGMSDGILGWWPDNG